MNKEKVAFTCLIFAVIAALFGCADFADSPDGSKIWFGIGLVLFAAFFFIGFAASEDAERD